MARHVVALLSDPHLSARRAYALPGWEACLAAARALSPALAVVAGDLALDDPDEAADRAFARERLDDLGPAAAWRAIPGNHDVGDTVAEPWMGQAINQARLDAYLAAHGDDRFAADVGAWRLIGLNAILFGTGLPREAAQWSWLRDAARDAAARPVALVLHKPLTARGPADPDGPNHLTAAARARLAEALGPARLPLVVSGHYHQHRALTLARVPQLWAPSTGLIGRDHGFGPFARRRPGFLALAFEDDDVAFAAIDADGGAGGADAAALIASHGPPRAWPEVPAARAAVVA